MLSAVSGFLSVIFYRGIAPESVALAMGTVLIFISIIGCALKIEGAFVGSVVYTILEDFTSQYTDRYKMLIGAFFILTVLFMDKGILGLDFKLIKDKICKIGRKSTNHSINGGHAE